MDDDDQFELWAGLALLGVIVLIIFLITYRTEQRAVVAGVAWERKVDIQTWTTVEESDWDIPSGGREIRSYRAIHHYDQVYVGSHQVCPGSGKDRRCTSVSDYESVPVYHTKYDYFIERWVVTRTPESHGTTYDAFWPPSADDLHDPNPSVVEIGDERKGTAYSHYHLLVIGTDKKQYDVDVAEADWRTMPIESHVTLVLNVFGQAVQAKR